MLPLTIQRGTTRACVRYGTVQPSRSAPTTAMSTPPTRAYAHAHTKSQPNTHHHKHTHRTPEQCSYRTHAAALDACTCWICQGHTHRVTPARDISPQHKPATVNAPSKRGSVQRTPCARRLTASHRRPDPGGLTARPGSTALQPQNVRGTNSKTARRVFRVEKNTNTDRGHTGGATTHTRRPATQCRVQHRVAALEPPTAMPPTQCCIATLQLDTMQVLHSNAQQSCTGGQKPPVLCCAAVSKALPRTVDPVRRVRVSSGRHVGY